jgi:hypothetical protein
MSQEAKKPLRSEAWFARQDKMGFYYRSFLKNRGFPQDQFEGRPVIGICNTWSELVWGFACQALTIAAPPSSAACSRSMTGDDDRRGACLGARGVAPQPCIRSARGEAGP